MGLLLDQDCPWRRCDPEAQELAALDGWVGGSLVQTRRRQSGTVRPFRYLSRSVGGRNRITYVSAGEMPAFRAAAKAGRRAAVLLERVGELTVAVLKAEARRRQGGVVCSGAVRT
jgi:hypothetical protein